jgi:predicted lipoprotein with Yx(FWY)xxD motif
MTTRRAISQLAGAAAIPLAVLAIAGCGAESGGSASSAPPETESGQRATVGVADTALGQILVDSNARTIYLFKKDEGTTSVCSGSCADAWPPVRTNGEPRVGAGVTASQVGTTTRSDGLPQVTYNGHPLYLYAGDQEPGDTTGQGSTGFGAPWYAVSPRGDEVTGQPADSTGGNSTYSGGY